MQERQNDLDTIQRYFRTHPIVAILGPRQAGKTTLAKAYGLSVSSHQKIHYFDLERIADLESLAEPTLALEGLEGLIVIDEIQRKPDLFPLLRVLVDDKKNQQFLILGSASRELIQQSSESLAGRIAYMELTPFSFAQTQEIEKLWFRGGFPSSYLAETELDSADWREAYISTFLEQDIPNLGIKIPAPALRRFWTMLAHYHANIFNAAELGRSLALKDVDIRRYLDILSGTFMIRQLQAWQENIKKRQVKAPKIYFRDSGLLHSLMRISSQNDLRGNPKLGASWEGFALEEIIRAHRVKSHDCYFWATHSGAELDLLLFSGNQRLGFEFKYTDAPKLTKSMCISYEALKLDELSVIYPGKTEYALTKNIRAKGLENYLKGL
jgi:predicted AAA+ superfamily ATPase